MPAARGRATSSTMPTATASSPAGWARTTAPSGWAARWCRCRAASASARSSSSREFGARVVLMTPSYMLAIADEFERQGIDPRTHGDARRPLRRRALDRGHAGRDRAAAGHRCRRSLWLERSDGPRRRLRVRRDQGRAHDLGGSLLSRDRRSRDRRAGARRRTGRAGVHDAHQGGDAGHPLPHARPHAADAGIGQRRCGAWPRSPAAATTC